MERVEELRERERLGRSRASEVMSAEVQLRRVLAELESVQGQEKTAQQLLEFLIGGDLNEGLTDPDPSLPALKDEAEYLAAAASRPDVLAAQEAWEVARRQVTIARADFWPDVDLESNYYTKRVGAAADVDWDVLLKVDVPLFQGGQTMGEVREASSQARQAKLAYERTQREALLDLRNAYAALRAAIQRSAALTDALAAAEENYRLQLEDYRRSLVSNLDVLQELRTLQDARRDEIQARHDAKRLYWRLLAATGETS